MNLFNDRRLVKFLTLLFFIIILPVTLIAGQIRSSFSGKAQTNPTLLQIDFSSSYKFYDKLDEAEFALLAPNFYPVTPGDGFTSIRPVVLIPSDYFDQVSVPQEYRGDEFVKDTVNQILLEQIAVYKNYIGFETIINPQTIIIRSEKTLNEIVCGSPLPCQSPDWLRLIHDEALPQAVGIETDPRTSFALFLFGGGGIAGKSGRFIALGDWVFHRWFGYVAPGCQDNGYCELVRNLFTIRHEMGHMFGIPWHSPGYVVYPQFSIMSSSEGVFNLADHSGYPEKKMICTSSYNMGLRDCDQYQSPNRPVLTVPKLSGRIINPLCTGKRFNPLFKVFFTQDPFGSGMGVRYNHSHSSVNEDGSFEIILTDKIEQYRRGYAFNIARFFPDPKPDINNFVLGAQFHFDVVGENIVFCDDNTGLNCQSITDEIIMNSTDENLCVPIDPSLSTTPTPTSDPYLSHCNGDLSNLSTQLSGSGGTPPASSANLFVSFNRKNISENNYIVQKFINGLLYQTRPFETFSVNEKVTFWDFPSFLPSNSKVKYRIYPALSSDISKDACITKEISLFPPHAVVTSYTEDENSCVFEGYAIDPDDAEKAVRVAVNYYPINNILASALADIYDANLKNLTGYGNHGFKITLPKPNPTPSFSASMEVIAYNLSGTDGTNAKAVYKYNPSIKFFYSNCHELEW